MPGREARQEVRAFNKFWQATKRISPLWPHKKNLVKGTEALAFLRLPWTAVLKNLVNCFVLGLRPLRRAPQLILEVRIDEAIAARKRRLTGKHPMRDAHLAAVTALSFS